MTKLTQAKCRKWIKALRSGEYMQGRKVLKEGDLYCCLGVAAEVCNLPREDEGYLMSDIEGLGDDEQQYLVDLNDIDRESFSSIADHIEKNILPNCPVR